MYLKILIYDGKDTKLERYGYSNYPLNESLWELMPENFNPNESKQLTIDDLEEGIVGFLVGLLT